MPINVNYKNPLVAFMKSFIQHYDHQKYWRYREYVTNPAIGGGGQNWIDNQILKTNVYQTM